MIPIKDDPIYQQSSRDASEEDAGDADSITSLYDSGTDHPSIRKPKRTSRLCLDFDEGENSATTSDAIPESHSSCGQKTSSDEQDSPMNLVDKRYVDVNSAAGRHMNHPPTDRPVRVYSDGIFDLFHLGCVDLVMLLTTDTCDNWSRRRKRFRMYIYSLGFQMMKLLTGRRG